MGRGDGAGSGTLGLYNGEAKRGRGRRGAADLDLLAAKKALLHLHASELTTTAHLVSKLCIIGIIGIKALHGRLRCQSVSCE